MPEPALPIPPDPLLRNLRPVRRTYRDLLQRPMNGRLILNGEVQAEEGVTVHPAPVRVQVVDGVLALDLAPGSYTLAGQLWGADEEQVEVSEAFEVEL